MKKFDSGGGQKPPPVKPSVLKTVIMLLVFLLLAGSKAIANENVNSAVFCRSAIAVNNNHIQHIAYETEGRIWYGSFDPQKDACPYPVRLGSGTNPELLLRGNKMFVTWFQGTSSDIVQRFRFLDRPSTEWCPAIGQPPLIIGSRYFDPQTFPGDNLRLPFVPAPFHDDSEVQEDQPAQSVYKINLIDSIPYAPMSFGSYIGGYDTNHNGLNELIFSPWHPDLKNQVFSIYEYRPVNKHELVYAETLTQNNYSPTGICDIDRDGLIEIVGVKSRTVETREGATSKDYPLTVNWEAEQPDSSLNWEDTLVTVGVPFVGDFDRDSKNEIWVRVYSYAGWEIDEVYENVADNENILVQKDTRGAVSKAWNDFDGDGINEFAATGNIPGVGSGVIVFKSSGDDQFQPVWMETPPFQNGFDVFAGNNLHGDVKPEFFVGFMQPTGYPHWTIYLMEYKAIGVNLYKSAVIDSFQTYGTAIARQSCGGDIDNDGKDEIIWSVGTHVIALKDTGNGQYERIWRHTNNMGGDRRMLQAQCYDFNNDGYKDIILSGEEKTQIWKMEPTSIPETKTIPGKPFISCLYPNYPNPLTNHTTIRYQIGPDAQAVSLQVYDASGRLVKDLARAQSPESKVYSIVWNGRDDDDRLLPAGVYFVELRVNNGYDLLRCSQKMIILAFPGAS